MRKLKAQQLPSGNYRTQVIAGYDEKGKRIVRSFTADTEEEALRLALNFRSDKAIGVLPKCMTVEQAFTQYIDARDYILSPSTIRGYEIIRKTRLQSIMKTNIMQLTINDIQRAINLDARRLSHKSLKGSLALLKSVLGVQGVDINIKRISLPPKRKKQVILPDVAEVLALIIGTDIELPCLLAMWMSLRISEVRGLQFRDIAKDGSSLQVCRAKMYFDGHDVVRDVNKTYDSTRNNSLPVYLLEMIRAIPHEREDEFIVKQSYPYIWKHFKMLMKEHGYDMTFHKLRHEFATTLNDLGIPSDYIQKLGGWATDNVMKSIYTHTTSAKEAEFQKKIDDFFMSLINQSRENNPQGA